MMKRIALFCAGLTFAAQVSAQSTDIQKMERVEVTGSSIKRIDGEQALPVTILKREDIDRIGATTTEELLKNITAITSAGSVTVSQANGTVTTSQANVSLRALGATRTLILVNGRRVTVFGGTTVIAVDVNSIPLAAIERVEVLKDGASSLYGSDAIAGVINFILRKDYTGGEVNLGYGSPTRSGGGQSYNASAYMGYGTLEKDRFNVNFGGGYEHTDRIQGSSRDFAHQINVAQNNDLTSTIAFPGNILSGPTFARLSSPAFANGCGPNSLISPFFLTNANSGQACRFENSPYLSVLPEFERYYALANANFQLNANLVAYGEFGYTHTANTYNTQPVPLSEATALPATNPYIAYINNLINTQYPTLPSGLRRFATAGDTLMLLPTTSPYYPTAYVASLGLPTNQPIAFRYRDFADGLRETRDIGESTRFLVGLKGSLGTWDFDSAFLYTQSKAESDLLAGYASYSRTLPIIDSGVVNPFGPTTDPAVLAQLQAAQYHGAIYTSQTSSTGVDFRTTKDILEMRSGPLSVAAGGEYRQEKYSFSPSTGYEIGDVAGFGGNILPVDKSRNVFSVYGEAAVPITKTLEADLGVRYDDYQTVGNTTNPKLSLRWVATPELLFRGSYGTGFRAPSLTDLYTPQASSVTANNSRDFLRCPNLATGSPTDCGNQFPTLTGGNPNLEPEKSKSGTFGIVFEPMRELSIGWDWYSILLKDSIVIGGLNSATILASAANETQFASFIIRGAPDGNPSGLGPIVSVIQTTSNLFKVKVQGWDMDVAFRPNIGAGQRLTMRLDGSYVQQFKRQNFDGSYSNQADTALVAAGGIIPKWRHVASITYDRGPWEASVTQNFQDSYHDVPANITGTPRTVGVYETWDMQARYLGLKSWQFTVGAKNFTDKNPPYTNEGGQFAAGYDITYSDVRGRFIYGSVKYTFK
ncbi:MAG TPA: TonB-dependent receptor [Usitatibacter sp.]|nr:TonB-dependent receptor [Usitatibacter sp.]